MLLILFAMAAGIALGRLSRRVVLLQRFAKFFVPLQKVGCAVLLFCIGVGMGCHRDFWVSLAAVGTRGLVLAIAACLGSVLAVFPLSRMLLRGNGK